MSKTTTRFFKVIHKAGAFVDGVHYPVAEDGEASPDSIVPLQLAEDAQGPLWGVEVDAQGNEIDAPAPMETIADKMAEGLANKIATGSAKPTLSAEEAAARKQTIVDTLALLDHSKDADWVMNGATAGKPRVDVVESASGLVGLTRGDIDEAAPDFKREAQTA